MRAFAEITRRPRLADEVGCCGGCTDDDREDDRTTPTYGPAVEPATPDSGLQLGANSLSSEATSSHLKAALLDVVELQAEGLYAAEDSPLVTKQTDPDAPDVTEETSSDTHNQGSTGNLVFSFFGGCCLTGLTLCSWWRWNPGLCSPRRGSCSCTGTS